MPSAPVAAPLCFKAREESAGTAHSSHRDRDFSLVLVPEHVIDIRDVVLDDQPQNGLELFKEVHRYAASLS